MIWQQSGRLAGDCPLPKAQADLPAAAVVGMWATRLRVVQGADLSISADGVSAGMSTAAPWFCELVAPNMI
jgi:hypothetical protein